MRFNIEVDRRPKLIAKHLKRILESTRYERSHVSCLNLVSRMYGLRNWQDLASEIGKYESSLLDNEIDEDAAFARFEQHIAVLVEDGIPEDLAEDVILEIAPTGRRAYRLDGSKL